MAALIEALPSEQLGKIAGKINQLPSDVRTVVMSLLESLNQPDTAGVSILRKVLAIRLDVEWRAVDRALKEIGSLEVPGIQISKEEKGSILLTVTEEGRKGIAYVLSKQIEAQDEVFEPDPSLIAELSESPPKLKLAHIILSHVLNAQAGSRNMVALAIEKILETKFKMKADERGKTCAFISLVNDALRELGVLKKERGTVVIANDGAKKAAVILAQLGLNPIE